MKRIFHVGIFCERTRTYGRRILEGIAFGAQESGNWELDILTDKVLTDVVALRRFDGFIARLLQPHVAECILAADRPTVNVFPQLPDLNMPIVDHDTEKVGAMAAEHLLSRRFKNFAFCGFDSMAFSNGRRDAFIAALREQGFGCSCYQTPAKVIRCFPSHVVRNECFFAADAAELKKWLKSLVKPIAIFCANDLRAYQVIRAGLACNIDIPHEMAVLGVDDDPLVCGFSSPNISSVNPDAFEIGRTAAHVLRDIFNGNQERPVIRIPPKGVTARASTASFPLQPTWMSDALLFIHQNVNRTLSAVDVFKYLGLSHTTVETTFKRELGHTVQKEIMQTRLEEAHRLLLHEDTSVTEIAKRCGFASINYFSRMFTTQFGKPPTVLRSMIHSSRP